VLAAACILMGLAAPLFAGLLGPVVHIVAGIPLQDAGETLQRIAVAPLGVVTVVGLILLALTGLLALLRRWLLSGRRVREAVTWDCGYAVPTARMEYTASSFAQPLTGLFRPLLGTRERLDSPRGYFPEASSLSTATPDACRERLFAPLFRGIRSLLDPLRVLQHGHLHLYILYIAATLLVLMAWQMGFTP
jgi:hydrogenase-4 component B